jgi:hypothetical protein
LQAVQVRVAIVDGQQARSLMDTILWSHGKTKLLSVCRTNNKSSQRPDTSLSSQINNLDIICPRNSPFKQISFQEREDDRSLGLEENFHNMHADIS